MKHLLRLSTSFQISSQVEVTLQQYETKTRYNLGFMEKGTWLRRSVANPKVKPDTYICSVSELESFFLKILKSRKWYDGHVILETGPAVVVAILLASMSN